MTGCRHPIDWVTASRCPVQTSATAAQLSGQPPPLCQLCWGQERQRLASGSQLLGLMSSPLPSRALALCPGRVRGQGQGRETAAASDPEQKTE